MAQLHLEYRDLTVEQLHFFLTYVHKQVRIREFPIDITGFTFEAQNRIHDFEYWRGGRERHRRRADRRFLLGCLKQTVKEVKARYWLRFFCGVFAYWLMVRAFGQFSFSYYDKPAITWQEFLQRCDYMLREV